MGNLAGFESFTIPAAIVPLLVFFARVVDVSLGTLRIIIVGRGMRFYAAVLGFLEVFIWLLAISQVLQHLNGWYSYLMYSAGFAVGTYVGMTIERRLKLGHSIIRVVAPVRESSFAQRLRERGHTVTHIDATGTKGAVEVIFSVVRGEELHRILNAIREDRPDAFYSVEDVRLAKEDGDIAPGWQRHRRLLQSFYWFRKSK